MSHERHRVSHVYEWRQADRVGRWYERGPAQHREPVGASCQNGTYFLGPV